MRNFISFSNVKFAFVLTVIFAFSQIAANAGAVADRTFGTNGSTTTSIGTSAQVNSVIIQTDGKILAVGTVGTGDSQDTVLIRYNSNGSLDSGFGNNGIVITALSPVNEKANDLGLQSDGKIIVAGNITTPASALVDFMVARFNQNGTLDSTFGANGIATFDQSATDIFNAVAIQPDNKIVAVGGTSQNSYDFAAIRFNSNGTLDTSFSNGGIFILDLPHTTTSQFFRAVKLFPNGRIIIGGSLQDISGGDDVLVTLETNGVLAQDFGTGGIIQTGNGGSSSPSQSIDLSVLPDGKFLTLTRYSIIRRLSNGAMDATFPTQFGLPGSPNSSMGTDFAVRSDGRYIVLNQGSNRTAAYGPNGGYINLIRNLSGSDIAVQGDDKFVIVSASGSNFNISRYSSITSPATRIADFDYDEKSDLIVHRSGQTAYVLKSQFGATTYIATGRIMPEDYSSSLDPDFPINFWRTDQNFLGYFTRVTESGSTTERRWGMTGDIPVGGDYDGKMNDFIFPNKQSEAAIFRPSDGTWWIRLNNTHFVTKWGINGDKPVPADYDYDGITDFAVYRPSSGTWWILRSSDRSYMEIKFGIASDIPLTGDFDGDGKADFTVYRPSEGIWYQLLTRDGFRGIKWGIATDYPVPGDYDGDGKHDIAVYREGIWYLLESSSGMRIVSWGNPGDIPIAVRYDQ